MKKNYSQKLFVCLFFFQINSGSLFSQTKLKSGQDWACLIRCRCSPPGVITYSVGIAWAAQDELEYIATDPDKEHSFFVDEFDNLYKFVPRIVNNICQEFNSQPRN